MSFWSDVYKSWKAKRAEKDWMKKFDQIKVSPEIQTEKAAFTARGEPWVSVIRMEVDPTNLSDGAFELDWNEIFVARLVKAGYHGKDDKAIVEQWFNNICSNVVAGTYEQEMADPEKRRRVQRKRIDKSTTEVS
jgi:hypothetical protein